MCLVAGGIELSEGQLGVADDGGVQVIEVVGHSRGESACRSECRRCSESDALGFGRPSARLPGDLAEQTDHTVPRRCRCYLEDASAVRVTRAECFGDAQLSGVHHRAVTLEAFLDEVGEDHLVERVANHHMSGVSDGACRGSVR